MKNKINKPLTDMQRKFANLYVESVGRLSNTECAIRAGYDADSAYQRSYELLNARICPHVVKYISERREDFLKKNDIDPKRHLARLHHLALKAEEEKMYGVSLRAEELRGKVAGYYVERSLIKNVEEESEEQLEQKMKQILDDNKLFIDDKKTKKNKNN